jgi:aspartate kinase
VPERDLAKTIKAAQSLSRRIRAGKIIHDKNIAKISVVGIGMRSHSGVAAQMFEALAKARVNIEMISTSEIKISCVIKRKAAEKAIKALHKKFKLGKKK